MLLVESCHTQVLESCYPHSNEAEVTHGSNALAVYHKQLLECCNPERHYLHLCTSLPKLNLCRLKMLASMLR